MDRHSYLTAADVMVRFSISDQTLSRWLRDPLKRFPRPLVIGRRRLFDPADLDAWERSHRETAAA
jgi:predicted DNA-binding transcriptional regulator AlpA